MSGRLAGEGVAWPSSAWSAAVMMMFRFFIAGLPSSLLAMERRTPLSLTASRRRWATPSSSAAVLSMRSASAATKPFSPSARRQRYSTTFTKSVAARGATLMSSTKKNSIKVKLLLS